MELGNIVEFIDRQKILCAVILEIKKLRLRLLTETNCEVKISADRLSHRCNRHLDLSLSRELLVARLKEVSSSRKSLIDQVDVKELWEVLNTEQEWIDLETMTEFCFPENPSADHESAVVRAFFENRHYFKFNGSRFFPHSEADVIERQNREKETARMERIVAGGSRWIKQLIQNETPSPLDLSEEERKDVIETLKLAYLNQKESRHYPLGKKILRGAGIGMEDSRLLRVLVNLGGWDKDENLDLIRFGISSDFPEEVKESAEKLVKEAYYSNAEITYGTKRVNLTDLPLITIDGQATLDYDDALSIEKSNDQYRLGIHISDVGHFIKRGSPIDQEAVKRASSIYTPDRKIPMIPPGLAEGLCSLRAGELRPAISTFVEIGGFGNIVDVQVVPSLITVQRQLSYYDVNTVTEEDEEIRMLYDIAKKFRQKRLAQGALQITLPEINIWINQDGEPAVSRINRESPGRMLVAELMIMANWLMAEFLSDRRMPAIFRSQPEPRGRLFKNNEGTLFQNWAQRKLLNRFSLGPEAEHHAGLGLNAYVTATSPIRKYFDLVTQRQIRAVLGLDKPYTKEEINHLIQTLGETMSVVSRIQYNRNRYWLLRHLETMIGEMTEAIVISKKRNAYSILLKDYMLECDLPFSSGIDLKPEDLVRVKIQQVNARNDTISVFIG
ncbi:MAG: RNB domain-containing ribonuclease [Deltaproteobacteria bacterium]|jgi:exoribonuclease-2|nr:RNB domain-containing ribonuclease [Deltaproteobacteria bacterium]